jgi:two-component system CheB/CheR fusion protein
MSKCEFLIAIGASAGGLDPCERFFNEAPVDSGFAYVVVQHLSPDFRSLMDELLARHSSMPIHRVENGMPIKANTIYLNRPRQILTVSDERFVISPDEGDDVLRLPIDSFFESVAYEFKDRSVGVVLSGSGSDGSRGARQIKSAGGRVFVQTPETAKFESMPKAVLKSNIADGKGHPEELPELIVNHIAGKGAVPIRNRRHPTDDPYGDILDLLQDRFGTDFQNYKPETIKRRLDRRLDLAGYGTLSDYFLALLDDDSELETIYSDLLIEVTAFFRDEEAFDVIEKDVIPKICAEMSGEHQIRMWVPGCASGEEAYSLAMLVAEYARENDKPFNLKILATDVHQRSLSAASAGTYSRETLARISDEHIDRYFEKIGDYYQVRPNLRRAVVFSPHDLMSDPPFTRMDLVSCRNVMIYLTEEAQRKLLTLFHFSLRKGGALFLGPSETTGKLAHEFSSISKRWRIVEKKRDVRIFDSSKVLKSPRSMQRGNDLYCPSLRSGRDTRTGDETAEAIGGALQDLLKLYAPPGFLVNQDGRLVHIFGDGKKHLSFNTGSFDNRLEDLIAAPFKAHVVPMLERFQHGITVENSRSVVIEEDDGTHEYRLSLRQMNDANGLPGGYGLFCIEEAASPRTALAAIPPATTDDEVIHSYSARVSELEHALQSNEETLQSTIEEMETSNEELQATNEELMSANEELQSTNEELHSVNEELYTVSAEHQRKIEELTEITSDMDHLLKSTDIGTIFLDTEFHVRRFTPAASKTFNLIAQDIGRPFAHVTARFSDIDIFDLARKVQETLEPLDREILADGRSYLMRILPYVAYTDYPAGVVITAIDIHDLKKAQTRVAEITQLHSEVLQDVGQLILRWRSNSGEITYCSTAFADVMGRDVSGIVGREVSGFLQASSWKGVQSAIESITPGAFRRVIFDQQDRHGETLKLDGLVRAISDAHGSVAFYQFSGRDLTADRDYNLALESVLDVDRLISGVSNDHNHPHLALEDARISKLVKIVKDYIGAKTAILTIGAAGEEDYPLTLDEVAAPEEIPEGVLDLLQSLLPGDADEIGNFQTCSLSDSGKGDDQKLLAKLSAHRIIAGRIASKNAVIGHAAFVADGRGTSEEDFTALERSLVRVVLRWIGYILERRRRIGELDQQRALHQSLYLDTPAMMFSTTPTLEIENVNTLLAETGGYRREDMIGKPLSAFFDRINADLLAQFGKDHPDLQGTLEQQYLFHCASGQPVEV